MRKGALLLATLIAVTAPTAALAAKKKKAAAPAAPAKYNTTPANATESSQRFVSTAIGTIFVPVQMIATGTYSSPPPAAMKK